MPQRLHTDLVSNSQEYLPELKQTQHLDRWKDICVSCLDSCSQLSVQIAVFCKMGKMHQPNEKTVNAFAGGVFYSAEIVMMKTERFPVF